MKDKHVLVTGGTGGLGLGVTPTVLAQDVASVTIGCNDLLANGRFSSRGN